MTAREAALLVLHETEKDGAYLNLALKKQLDNSALSVQDKGLASELVYGVWENKIRIDYIISNFSKLKPTKISPWIFGILRLGVYQLLFLDKIPVSAACNESVKLAKRYGHAASSGFVNGILRNIAKNRDSLEYPDRTSDFKRFLSVFYSYPDWMVSYFTALLGNDGAEKFFAAGNAAPPLTIRVNTLKLTADTLIGRLAAEGVEASHGRLPCELILNHAGSIERLNSYRDGLFYVQDTGAMLTSIIASPKPGDTVLDLCAAPGGKSCHMAELMENHGKIYAFDIYEHKIQLIKENADRLGIKIIEPTLGDGSVLMPTLENAAELVLCDVPCMGLGIMRRKPDIKYTKTYSDLKSILPLQRKILDTAARYVKPGGHIVYSTCSLCSEENQGQLEEFLRTHENFRLESLKPVLPPDFKETVSGMVTLYPHIDGTDGFFVAKLKKEHDCE